MSSIKLFCPKKFGWFRMPSIFDVYSHYSLNLFRFFVFYERSEFSQMMGKTLHTRCIPCLHQKRRRCIPFRELSKRQQHFSTKRSNRLYHNRDIGGALDIQKNNKIPLIYLKVIPLKTPVSFSPYLAHDC